MDCLYPCLLCSFQAVAAEDKYDWGAGVRGYEVADYPCEASMCEGQELGGG